MMLSSSFRSGCILKLTTTLLLAASYLVHTTNAYASWLKCYVPLEEDEVIMNNRIVSFDNADHKVKIEVEAVDDEWFHPHELTYEEGAKLSLRLNVPHRLAGSNVQYVMETTSGGKFETGVCDGRRATATSYSDPVVLQLSDEEDEVQVWAGWATGHEEVRLTSRLTLTKYVEEEL